ncbi:MAG: ribosome assembly factor SBDS [bacterium]|nr:ribosome assembly factor SBDS [bacterium]
MAKKQPVVARLRVKDKIFEILVDPDLAFEYKIKKKQISIYNILAVDEIFKDARKGEKFSPTELKKVFGTEDVYQIAKKILEEGELQITTEQRRQLIEQLRKQIAFLISRYAIDPRTKAPHPPERILTAMEKARVSIDPFKSAEEQVEGVIEAIKKKNVLPMIIATRKLEVVIPAEIAPKIYSQVKRISGIKSEEWLNDGSCRIVLEVPAGVVDEIIGKINKLGEGKISFRILEQ